MVDALSIILPILLVAVGLGLGSTLTKADFTRALKKPQAAITGIVCQFGIMPVMAFSLAKAFDFSDEIAFGCVLTGSCPGGVSSNLFTYLSRGDVGLSVTMSAISTLSATFMIPLLMLLFIDGGMSCMMPKCVFLFLLSWHVCFHQGAHNSVFFFFWLNTAVAVSICMYSQSH
jgi:predicted Na+-dependent transporter